MSSSGPAGSRRGNRATARRVHKLDLPSKDADQPPRLTSPPTGRITPKNSEVDRPDELASDQCSRAAVPRSGCLVRTIYLQIRGDRVYEPYATLTRAGVGVKLGTHGRAQAPGSRRRRSEERR